MGLIFLGFTKHPLAVLAVRGCGSPLHISSVVRDPHFAQTSFPSQLARTHRKNSEMGSDEK